MTSAILASHCEECGARLSRHNPYFDDPETEAPLCSPCRPLEEPEAVEEDLATDGDWTEDEAELANQRARFTARAHLAAPCGCPNPILDGDDCVLCGRSK